MAIYEKVTRARGGVESLLAEGVATLRSALGLAPEPGRYVPVEAARSRAESLLAEQVDLLGKVADAMGRPSCEVTVDGGALVVTRPASEEEA